MIQRIIKSSGFVSDNFHNKPTMSRTVIIRQLTFSEITPPQKVSLEVEHWSPRSKATLTAARTSPHCEDSSNLRHSSKIRHDKAEVQACRCQIRLQIFGFREILCRFEPVHTPVRSSDAERKFAINIHIAVEIGDHN